VPAGAGNTATTPAPGSVIPFPLVGTPVAPTTVPSASTPASTLVVTPAHATTVPSPPLSAPGPTTVLHPTAAVITITEQDAGHGFAIKKGDTVVVTLTGSAFDYGEPQSSNDAVLHRVSGSTSADGSATATFTPGSDGDATITAAVDAKCRRSVPQCEIGVPLYQVTVTVVG
jgi:hypothetical protein